MRKTFIYLCLTALAATLAAAPHREHTKKRGDVIVGGLFNLEGSQGELDIPSSKGSQLAVDEVNAAGGVLGRKIQLIVEDGRSRPKVLARATRKILKQYPSVSAFVGLSDTDMVLGAAPVAAASGRLFLTSGATSPQLPSEVPQYLYLACFGDNVQAAAAAEFAFEKLGANTAAVLYDSTDSYTNLLQGYFRTRFVELGGTIVSAEAYEPADLSGPISRLQQADVVFLAAHTPNDAVEASGMLRDAGFLVPIVGGDGFDDEEEWAAETALSDVYFTTHVYLGSDASDPQVTSFRAAYAAAYPGETATAFSALGYDAMKLIAEAIRRAGSARPADVLAGLAGIQDFEGVTGTISYPDGTRIPLKSVSIVGIDGGAYRFAAEWTPTSVPAP
jgi:branched-chain amino acid transport system substrate-binding protein